VKKRADLRTQRRRGAGSLASAELLCRRRDFFGKDRVREVEEGSSGSLRQGAQDR